MDYEEYVETVKPAEKDKAVFITPPEGCTSKPVRGVKCRQYMHGGHYVASRVLMVGWVHDRLSQSIQMYPVVQHDPIKATSHDQP